MDLISTLSTILEVPWVIEDFLGLDILSGSTNIIKAGRASRVSSRATKIIRIVRLIRIVRISKLYKYAQQSIAEKFNVVLTDQSDRSSEPDVEESSPKIKSNKIVPIITTYDEAYLKPVAIKRDRSSSVGVCCMENADKISGRTALTPQFNKSSHEVDKIFSKILSPFKQNETKNIVKPYFDKKHQSLDSDEDQEQDEDYLDIEDKPQVKIQKRMSLFNMQISEMAFEQQKQKRSRQVLLPPILQTISVDEQVYEGNLVGKYSQRLMVIKKQKVKPMKINLVEDDANPEDDKFQTKTQEQNNQENSQLQETNVGRQLSDLTTKRAIMLMFSVMVSIPFFSYETYWTQLTSQDTGTSMLWTRARSEFDDVDFFVQEFVNFHKDLYIQLSQIVIKNQIKYNGIDYTRFRNEELQIYEIEGDNDIELSVVFVQHDYTELNAILGVGRTTFVIIILVCGAIMFSKDANDFVVVPIENMLAKVNRIAANPLEAAKIQEDEDVLEEELQKNNDVDKIKEHLERNTYETVILEKLIIKTGALLAIGFGEAGANIIAENISKGDAVNPLLAGNKVVGIFGFCDIRNFTDMTEILQERVMLFVNDIANIVHTNVHNCHGSANKNIGDAFLLVWKIPKSIVKIVDNDSYKVKKIGIINSFADFALLSFVKIMIQLQQSQYLNSLCQEEIVQSRIPGYSLKLGFGLHIGWAIEGAIGSEFKIDASYLSPNVNMAARLETATKQYGSLLLLSGQFQQVLSERVQKFNRHIDRVTVKGSSQPIDLYTFDMDLSKIEVNEQEKTKKNGKVERYFNRQKLEKQLKKLIMARMRVHILFTGDQFIQKARESYKFNFFLTFKRALNAYLEGEWQKAQKLFNKTLHQVPGKTDGPSLAILSYMETHDFMAPSDWEGFRMLQEK